MFAVKPVRDKNYQKELCEALDTPYIPESLAYFAADLCEDMESVESVIGVCQFTVDKTAEIVTLCPAEGRIGDEAMIVMCRSVMSLLYKLGIRTMTMADDAGPAEMLEKTGIPRISGVYTVDLFEFYKEPCRYGKKNDD